MRYYISEDTKKFELCVYRVDDPLVPATCVTRFVSRRGQSTAFWGGVAALVAELNQLASIMPDPGPGTFATAAGAHAKIVGAKNGYMYGDLEGVGPTSWGYDGRHLTESRLDLVRRLA